MSAAYLSISFSRMNEANRKVGKAGEEARYEGESLSRAISSLQVSDSRLRMKAEALSSLRSRINRRQGSLQAMGAHIDYAVRRFQEVDNLCAQRIKSNGSECAKLMGLSTQNGIYGSIVSGLNSIANQGKAAWDYIKKNGNKILDCVQTGLDLIGLIPGLGEIADGINAGIYLLRGDYTGAALSLAAMIPIAGCAATAGKFIYKGLKACKQAEKIIKVIDKAGDLYGIVKKVGNKGIQKVASKAGDVFENISRAIGKKPDLVAEGAGIFKGSVPDFGKVGIPELKKNPVQKNFNAIYGNPGAGKAAEANLKKIDDYISGNKNFDEVIDDYAKIYSDNINSNKPWSWDESILGGENLTKKQRSLIKEQAVNSGLIPEVKVEKVDGMKYGFADFESAGVVKETLNLPGEMWKVSDAEQFKWLDEQIGGTVEGYTWHHTEIPGKMELVPTGIHNITTHNGGRTAEMWADAPR